MYQLFLRFDEAIALWVLLRAVSLSPMSRIHSAKHCHCGLVGAELSPAPAAGQKQRPGRPGSSASDAKNFPARGLPVHLPTCHLHRHDSDIFCPERGAQECVCMVDALFRATAFLEDTCLARVEYAELSSLPP